MTDSTDLRRKALWIKQRDHLCFEAVAKRSVKPVYSDATKIDMEALKQDVEQYPDADPYERAQRLGVSRRGIDTLYSA